MSRERVGRVEAAWASLLLAVGMAFWSSPAEAIELHRRWSIGFRAADYLPADEQGGGFRFNAQTFGSRTENEVKISEVPVGSFILQYGVKKWSGGKRAQDLQMSVELEVSRISGEFGDETGFIDENASTRVEIPGVGFTTPDGDERFETFPLGDLTMTPILVNALFHWGRPRADFYVGGGGGILLAEFDESRQYAEFMGDIDGTPDVRVEDGGVLSLKLGSNVRLTKSGHWLMFFEAEFFSGNVLGGGPKVAWPGGEAFLDTCDYDSDQNGALDRFNVPCQFHLVDPGKVRTDGVLAGLGIRYQFGGKKRATTPPAEVAPASGL